MRVPLGLKLCRGKQRIARLLAKAFSSIVFPNYFILHYTMDSIPVKEPCELMAPPLSTNGCVANNGARTRCTHTGIDMHIHILHIDLPVRDERGE